MKRISTHILIILVALFFHSLQNNGYAQFPEKICYQAVVRSNQGELVVNQLVSIRIQILKESEFGPAVYVETHMLQSNENGLLTLEIGNGTTVVGSLNEIKWEEGPYFLRTEIDHTGGTNYSIVTTSEFLAIPYAFYAAKAGKINETDPIFINSVARDISADDTTSWNSKLDSFIETDPVFNASVAKGITSDDTARWNDRENLEIQDLKYVLTQGNDGGGQLIKNIANPSDEQDAATKAYADDLKLMIDNLARKVCNIEAGDSIVNIGGND